MTLIDKYITKSVLKAIVLTVLLLSVFQLFVLFVNELGDIGQGNYTVFHAFYYVLLRLPYDMYLFFPEACLLGGLLGLGMLANSNELLIIRAQGVSILKVTGLILNVALIVVLLVCVVGEFVLPSLSSMAEEQKTYYRSSGQTLKTAEGLWLRVKNQFIYIKDAKTPHNLSGILAYEFNPDRTLKRVRKINKAVYKNGAWELFDVVSTRFQKEKVVTEKKKQVKNAFQLPPEQIAVSNKLPNEMQLTSLWRYIQIKKQSHSRATLYEMNFWRRIFQPIITCVMMFLSIPFIFGSLRESSMGKRVLVGALAGFCFFTMNELSVPVGQIFRLPPFWVAATPSIFFSLLGLLLITKMRR
jgi:lipopolysaccharide export system permease protein